MKTARIITVQAVLTFRGANGRTLNHTGDRDRSGPASSNTPPSRPTEKGGRAGTDPSALHLTECYRQATAGR